ncbi:MAG: 3-deoxy-D-manno-octulosonic acid transferase [Thermoanaerobaculia bacterium]
MWGLYQIAFGLALALAGPWLVLARGKHYLPTLAGRLGRGSATSPAGALWLHAVSVGEVGVAATLAGALPADAPLLVTTITPTGQDRARRLLARRGAVDYLPFDLGFALARFFRRHDPRGLVLVEGDYWPLVLRAAGRRGMPIAVANGRVSDRAYPRLRRARSIVRRLLFDRVERFAVQSPIDRERLIALGVAPEKVAVTGNLKFETAEPALAADLDRYLETAAAGRPVVLAGSTMPGEEEVLLAAFAAAGGPQRALLVLAPRHPERFAEAQAIAERRFPRVARRSAGAPASPPDVLLLDTLGELAALYRRATVAFVGGTLAPTGGHNPIEAARFGVPVLVGPSMENFREIAELFDAAGAWLRVADAAGLGRALDRLLADEGARRALGERAATLVESHRGALARTVAWLAPWFAPSAGRGDAEAGG